MQDREFSNYTLELGWTPSYNRVGWTNTTNNLAPSARLLYLWAFRGSVPQDLERGGQTTDDWRDRGCRLYGPVHFSPIALPAPLHDMIIGLTPGETPDAINWDYHIRAACLGFPAETFFREAFRAHAAFVGSHAATVLTRHMGQTVQRDALIRELTNALATRRRNVLRLRCAPDQKTGQADLDRLYIGIRANNFALFPAPSSLAPEAPVAQACPDRFVIPAP